MARNRPYTTQSFEFDYPCFISCPEAWKKAEKAYIRLSILYRADTVGTLDLSKYIPREFAGYYYLIRSGAILKNNPIEFRHQELYFDEHIWESEQMIQSSISDLSTPDTDIDSIDELSRVIGFTGGFLLDILTNLNIPLLDLGLEAIQGIIDAIASDDLNYFPSPNRPDKIAFSIPDGLVNLRLEFGWVPYSPIMIAGGLSELSIDSQIELIAPSELSGLGSNAQIKSFGDIALSKGYIAPSGIGAACLNAGYIAPSGIGAACLNAGYILASDAALQTISQAKQAVANSGFSATELLNQLKSDGAISQADIDAIKAEYPNASDAFILDKLIESGKASPLEISKAIQSLEALKYRAVAGKKKAVFWYYPRKSITAGCAYVWDLFVLRRGSNGVPNSLALAGGLAIVPTTYSIPWTDSQIPYDNPLEMPTFRLAENNPNTVCGDLYKRMWINFLGVDVTSAQMARGDFPVAKIFTQP